MCHSKLIIKYSINGGWVEGSMFSTLVSQCLETYVIDDQ